MIRLITLALFVSLLACQQNVSKKIDGSQSWLILTDEDVAHGAHHLNHSETFAKYAPGYNKFILKGIDKVQATAMDGGGYFIGIKAVPTESPVGYPIRLLGKELLDPPRTTSYCSGASYAAFIEGLNALYSDSTKSISQAQIESLRMQEPDGGRREDHIKFWGKWNADGFGNHFALAQYGKMGQVIEPQLARSGDFMNISWKSGIGHSVVFLGWYVDAGQEKNVVYWSSQKGTNGLGDQIVSLDRIKSVKIVRMTNPENIFNFDPNATVNTSVPGDSIVWN